MMSSLAINTAPSGNNNLPRRANSTRPNPLTNLHVARTSRDEQHPMDVQMLSPLSPDAKRRRLHQTYVPPPSASSSSTPRSASVSQPQPGTPYPFPTDPRRQSLPRPDMVHHARGVSPRNNSLHHHPQQRDGNGNNLTLPPLQTANHHHHHPYPAAASAVAAVAARHSSGGGTPVAGEAMLGGPSPRKVGPEAAIWNKIQILGKIAPPYRAVPSSSSSPSSAFSPSSSLSSPPSQKEQQQQQQQQSQKVRGAIVAVEGDDVAAAKAMGKWLEESFNKTGEVWARMAEAPRGPEDVAGSGGDVEIIDADADTAGGAKSPGDGGGGGGGNAAAAAVGIGDYIQVISEWHGKTKEMVEFITSPPDSEPGSDPPTEGKADGAADKRTPVLVMPTYSLRATDAWANRLRVGDNYSRSDHWQWSATLWRGIVGPDITVYVRDVSELELPVGKPVDVLEHGASKCLMVKRVVGKEVEESALRRLGFEIGELIRSVSQVNGK
ncbi:putative hmg box transcriptional [Diplodia seriata]|uniref:Putative hmg box transcriptional n=1 Tax=Diplodia seriata TaxID=420778 RepID=A0A0G2FP06_9PEZI|nr:putative hmg box transcriptional [Diplodia seriata]